MRFLRFLAGGVLLAFLSGYALAQAPAPDAKTLEGLFPGKAYSPYAGFKYSARPLFGDTHLHTAYSMDAGAFGARLDMNDAYKFARGEEVISSTGQRVKLSRPLDFLVVADHSDNMGFFPELLSGNQKFLADPVGRDWYDRIQKGGSDAVSVALEVIEGFSNNTFPPALESKPGTPAYAEAWRDTYQAAEAANEPGVFTAFIGWEWTSNTGGANLHRVLVYRDDATKASQLEPYTTIAPLGSDDPKDLWKWMGSYEEKTGGRILAIAHNGNLSNGIMFPQVDSFTKRSLNKEYVRERAKWEPLYEATQIKGDGETHPFLSPDDEFADYETWDQANLTLSEAKEDWMLEFEYTRSGLQQGLIVEERVGQNPYKFGLIGSTDSHTALATAQEDNFFGKHSGVEPSAERPEDVVGCMGNSCYYSYDMAASGYAAVWAVENTREAIFDAMMRKETYATTGPRMAVRFFGGWEFDEADANTRQPALAGYTKGVPMGGDLSKAPGGKAPTFLVAALKDPVGANLDRVQIIKGWVDGKKRYEKVYDVVWSGDRNPGPDGKLPPVGNTVDVANATWSNTIGATELIKVWKDPDFDPDVAAFYYVRVLEIPKPRWVAYDEMRFGVKYPDDVKRITQDRAYTSPIWYTP